MPVGLDQFVKNLTDSGVLSAGKLEHFLPPMASPKSAEDLAKELVRQKQLTRYQAAEIYQGRARSLILGNYTILDKIGAGGMGQVFKAEHRRMHRIVALKVLPKAVTKDAAAVARFQREVEAAARLNHPNIVTAHDADEAGGVNFLVMEFVEGTDLSALVKKDGPLPVDKAVQCILQAARGLEFAHGEGVVHRDIKPANLLLDKKGTVKILDMGLARIEAGGDAATQAELTGTGAVMGTVDYMSPEQALNTKHADARADIYSLGCALHYLLIGKPVFDGDTLTAKLIAHQAQPVPELRKTRGELSAELDTVFQKMVAKKVEDRYQTMSQVVADLLACVARDSTVVGAATSTDTSNENSSFSFLKDAATPTQHRKSAKAVKAAAQSTKSGGSGGGRKLLLIGGGFAAALVVLAGVLFKLRTKDGTLVVEIDQPDAVVQVDEGKVEITGPGEKGPISISVDPGKHRLKIEKEGFVVYGQDFVMESGGTQSIKATLIEDKPWFKPSFLEWQKNVAALPAEEQVKSVSNKLKELNPGFDGKLTGCYGWVPPKEENGVVTEIGYSSDAVTDISPMRALTGLRLLNCWGKGLADLSPLKGMRLASLQCHGTSVSDLSPIRDMHLTSLDCGFSRVSDLSPLKGMLLTYFDCSGNEVLSDLSPLKGLPLTTLHCNDTRVTDLSPLEGMSLESFWFTPKNVREGLDAVRRMNNLSKIALGWAKPQYSPDEFWQKYGEGEFGSPPVTTFLDPGFKKWEAEVAAMPAEGQIAAVRKKLIELNPDFDGTLGEEIAYGVVATVSPLNDHLTDISPLRAFSKLKSLRLLPSSHQFITKLADVSPLAGMALTSLDISGTKVPDLSPLVGMPLTTLKFDWTPISDLAPLKGMELTGLSCFNTKVGDLSPLIGMPLTSLTCYGTPISDLSPLQGMKLTELHCGSTPISDLAPLKGIPLAVLDVGKTQVSDLSPLEGMPLTQFGCSGTPVSDLSPLKGSKLTSLNITASKVGTLLPLMGLPLKSLACSNTEVSDLSPLKGMQLTELLCTGIQVSDLSPLKGMPLSILQCDNSKVTDLKPLHGMSLTNLTFDGTQVADLSPLRGMPLTFLNLANCSLVTDVAPLDGMRLVFLGLQGTKVTPAGVAALIKTLPEKCDVRWDKPAEVGKAWELPTFKQWEAELAKLPAEDQVKAVAKKLVELNPGFDGRIASWNGIGGPKIENGVVTELSLLADAMTDISPVRALAGLRGLQCGGPFSAKNKLADLSPLAGMQLTRLDFSRSNVSDLSLLRSLPALSELVFADTPVSDLTPLRGMALTALGCQFTAVTDLSPLKGMALTKLELFGAKVSDLSPLKGMPLSIFECSESAVFDVTPLDGMALTEITFTPQNITVGLNVIREMKSVKTLQLRWDTEKLTPDEFWKKYDAGDFGKPNAAISGPPGKRISTYRDPAFKKWEQEVATLPADQQVKAVAKKLQELNPGFDGQIIGVDRKPVPAIENGVVTEFGFKADLVTDISPVRALAGLSQLDVGSAAGKSNLTDLSPLKGMQLVKLWFYEHPISDLSPLAGMQLQHFDCSKTKVSDLSVLKGMPIQILVLDGTAVADLTPLKGMPLSILSCEGTRVSDLSPLEGMKLTLFRLTPANITKGIDTVRRMQTLQTIQMGYQGSVSFSPADFWKKYDAGEFGQPNAAISEPPGKHISTYKDPAFKKWMKVVAKLSAEEQVNAVTKKLQEINPGFDGQVTHKIEDGKVFELNIDSNDVTDLSPVRALIGLKRLGTGHFNGKGTLSDLSPLEGLPLSSFSCAYSQVSDLSPLKGMPLTALAAGYTQVSDLTPLAGMPLTYLGFQHSQVSDLSPIKGMALTILGVDHTQVSDVSLVSGMPLTSLTITPRNITKGMDVFRQMPGLREIGLEYTEMLPADEFWKRYDAGQFGKPASPAEAINSFEDAAFKKWTKEVAKLPAEEQIKAVAKKLVELNPGFDGKVMGFHPWDLGTSPKIENGVVTEFGFITDHVADVAPVRALAGLKNLDCRGTGAEKGRLSDLSPLQGMKLTGLICGGTRVADLSPLAGMPLTFMNCGGTAVSDLSPLKGMSLTYLHCDATRVSDLSPLQGMPLGELLCNDTQVSDLSVLKGINLEVFGFTPKRIIRGTDVIRQMKSLKSVGLAHNIQFPPDEFWKKYDARDIK